MKEMEYTVEAGGPLLPFLLERVRGSRNHVKSLLTRGQVEVDGKTVTRHDHPLTPGQRVAVLATPRPAAPFPVLYEDGRILVVDKPAGLLSMASDREKLRTAYRMATDYVRQSDPRGRVFIVHRLDRDTSGVLLFARDEETKRAYQEQWDALVRRRGYLAVVEGRPPREADTVRTLLRENAAHKVYSVRSGGKEAVTHFKVLERFGSYTYIECQLETGRTHQIRVHLSSIGHPLLGDQLYGPKKCPFPFLQGQTLHAMVLGFVHPTTSEYMEFTAPLPEYFEKLLVKLRGTL